MTLIGTYHGIQAYKALVAWSGDRNQNNILVLIANILIVMIATAALAAYEMSWKHSNGLPIFEPQSYCDVLQSY